MSLTAVLLFNFIIGILSLMYGVNLMSSGLKKLNLKTVRKALTLLTGNLFKSFMTGTVVTALVQSSTVVTVTSVGLVNSGYMTLVQAVGIIYGANIGTTVTAQLMTLNLYSMSWIILASGFVVKIVFRGKNTKQLGNIIMGLGFIFAGLGVLNSGVPRIRESKAVYNFLTTYGNNPVAALLAGTVATMLIHSSTTTVGITMVLFSNGMIGLEGAVALMLGDNIGTCATAQIASIKTDVNARRTAWAHTIYNLIGSFLVFAFMSPFCSLVRVLTEWAGQNTAHLVPNAHTVFNILSAAVFLPFTKYYVRFIQFIVKN